MEDILLDTNVLSEFVKPRPDPVVLRFLDTIRVSWLCSITFDELSFGAERSPDARRRAKLQAWITQLRSEFAGRTIPIDDDIAAQSGRMRAAAAAGGKIVSVVDALIASAAHSRGLRVATRNIKDFTPLGVVLVNPWIEPTRP
jgi:toxin FitB